MLLYQSYPQIGGFSYDPTGQLATVSLTGLNVTQGTSVTTNSPTSFYWSGEEASGTTAWALNFETGRWSSENSLLARFGGKTNALHWVRCVRTIPMAA